MPQKSEPDVRAQPPRPVIFGEVLFDRFADGTAILGGAPFNVAWHLQGFGQAPLFVSRVGADAAGRRVREAMTRWGMATAGLQEDPAHPTGRVEVTAVDGIPSYRILEDTAYDFIDGEAALAAVTQTAHSLLYHGTLAVRQSVSRQALTRLRADTGLPPFVDLNLRAPHWDDAGVADALAKARWVKLNDEELTEIAGLDAAAVDAEPALVEGARHLLRRSGAELAVVTRGARGALLATATDSASQGPVPVPDLVDTVGAGDAFSAVVILGLAQGWPQAVMLERAAHFAAAVCQQQGATAENPALYADFLERWQA